MKAKIKLDGKEILIENIVTCFGFKKIFGLMFKDKNTNALLFKFDRPTRQAIHSLFCPRFLAVWLDNEEVIDWKVVEPGKFSIKPDKKFTKLLEIPINKNNLGLMKSCNSDGNNKV